MICNVFVSSSVAKPKNMVSSNLYCVICIPSTIHTFINYIVQISYSFNIRKMVQEGCDTFRGGFWNYFSMGKSMF